MPITHIFLAILVATIWGLNFIFIKLSLIEFHPLLLGSLRFILASVPAILFIKPPSMPFKLVVLYGVVMFAIQFTFLFVGMHVGMTPGMASLIMQVQVFFSIFFAYIALSEVPKLMQIIGALISFIGIGLVSLHLDQNNITFLGFLCVLVAATAWGLGNLIIKMNNKTNMISLVIWGNFVAFIPMVILTLIVEGPSSIIYSYNHVSIIGVSSLLYTVCLSTWVGYISWNWLLSKYPMGTIVPFTLLVPVVGILSSVLIMKEPFESWKIFTSILVITGLYINIMSTRYYYNKIKLSNKIKTETI